MIQVELQQPVMFTEGNHSKRMMVRRGAVTKIGRVWIEVTPDGSAFAYRFRLDTQTNSADGNGWMRFYTLDQWAERERKIKADEYLREQGIYIQHAGPWFGREADLADIIRAAEAAESDGAAA